MLIDISTMVTCIKSVTMSIYKKTIDKRRRAQILGNALIVGLSVYCVVKKEEDAKTTRKKLQRSCWVNPNLRDRRSKGRFARSFENMVKVPTAFFENFHMSAANFDYLFSLVEQYLIPKRNTRPDAIPIKAKLAIVIEMLASGDLQRRVGSTYRISKQHMGVTVDLVCDAICTALAGEYPPWSNENMLKWAEEYEQRWDLPNCIGAIDGKHLRIRSNGCSTTNNYKGFNSIVFMAVSDASYRFSYVELGVFRREEDIFKQCKLGQSILSGNRKFPEHRTLNGVSTPYFLTGTDAFPLHTRIMKPYTGKSLTASDRIFNYRLGRASHCIEKALGILCSRWLAVQRTIMYNPQKANRVVSACCALHNFMMRSNSLDLYLPNHVEAETTLTDLQPFRDSHQDYPKYVRNNLSEYVNSANGSVSWQYAAAGVQRQ